MRTTSHHPVLGALFLLAACWNTTPEPEPAPPAEAATPAPTPAPAPAPAPARLVRQGAIALLPPVTAKVTSPPCGMEIDGSKLGLFSDRVLKQVGLGAASPIVVTHDGGRLEPFGAGDELTACQGRSRFARDVVQFSAPEEGMDPSQFALAFTDALPLRAPSGPVWWVYSDTGVILSVPPAPALAGKSGTLRAEGTVLGGAKATGQIVLSVGEQAQPLVVQESTASGEVPVKLGDKALGAILKVPQDGPHFVLQELTLSVGGEERDLLAEAATSAAQP